MHGIRQLEPNHNSTQTTKHLKNLLNDLIKTVSHPHLLSRQTITEVGRKPGAQLHHLPVRIAVQPCADINSGNSEVHNEHNKQRPQILVRIQPNQNIELKRTIQHEHAQVKTNQQLG